MKSVEAFLLLCQSLYAVAKLAEPNELLKVEVTDWPSFTFKRLARAVFLPVLLGNAKCQWFVNIGDRLECVSHTNSRVVLFSSDKVCISTNNSRFENLIFLKTNTKDTLLKLARTAATSSLDEANFTDAVDSEFRPYEKNKYVTVCVAFWVNGQVRGSMMASAQTLDQAVLSAAKRAVLLDRRWKPLSVSDIKYASVEITVFSPLLFPIKPESVVSLDYTKGYMSFYKDQIGLYVPEVFNAVRFPNTLSFFRSLAVTKGGTPNKFWRKNKFVAFEVIDFIGHANGSVIELFGSMPKVDSDNVVPDLTAAAEWLWSRQEADGNIVPTTKVFEQQNSQIDWVRLPFAVYALAEWLNLYPNEKYQTQLEISLDYCKHHLINSQYTSLNRLLGLIYLGQAYVTLGKYEMVELIFEKIRENITRSHFVDLQIYSLINHFVATVGPQPYLFEWQSNLHKSCQQSFLKAIKNRHTDAASWAEVVTAFRVSDPALSGQAAAWLISHQKSDGSFSQSLNNPFSYTRGSSKIFEVLAIEPNKYNLAINESKKWLSSMQYRMDSLYFVNPSLRESLVGSFRHDHGNPDVWIDSASHFILGSVRILCDKST